MRKFNLIEKGIMWGAAAGIAWGGFQYGRRPVEARNLFNQGRAAIMEPNNNEQEAQQALDLLAEPESWLNMPGTSVDPNGIRVNYLDRRILNQDGTQNITHNHPMNLYGKRLDVQGPFKISANLQEIDTSAVFQLYSEPAIILDEDRFDKKGIRFNFEDGTLWIDAWDGINKEAFYATDFQIPTKDNYNFGVEYQADHINLIVDGNQVGQIPNFNLFNEGRAFFGLDSDTSGGSYLLTGLTAEALPGGTAQVVDIPTEIKSVPLDANGLQQLASTKHPGKFIGAAVSLDSIARDPEYAEKVFNGNFGIITTENLAKPQHLQPERGKFTFGELDSLIDLAQHYGLQVHLHTLNFAEANPTWMEQAPLDQRRAILEQHITQVLTHTKGKIRSVDVINEPLHEDYFDGPLQLRTNHPWYEAMGRDHIEISLRAARAADPDVLLGINEWGLEADGDRWNGFLELVEDLLSKGVPLDYIGFQAHVYEQGRDDIDPVVLRRHFDQIKALGEKYGRNLYARISEMDVDDTDPNFHTSQYTNTMKVCMEADNCLDFTTWGISSENNSWCWVDGDNHFVYGGGVIWGRNYQATAAYAAMQAALRPDNTTPTTSPTPTESPTTTTTPTPTRTPTTPPSSTPTPSPTSTEVTPLPTATNSPTSTPDTRPTFTPAPTQTESPGTTQLLFLPLIKG